LVRLALEAVEQGAVLGLTDFSALLGLPARAVRWLIGDFARQGIDIPHAEGESRTIWPLSHGPRAVRLYLQCTTRSGTDQKRFTRMLRPARQMEIFAAVSQALRMGVPQHQIPETTGLPGSHVDEYLSVAREFGLTKLSALPVAA
jgi:hypothetical protein